MRCSSSTVCFALIALLVALAPTASDARRHAAPPAVDSSAVDVPAPPVPPDAKTPTVRKRIVIGGSGVRIDDQGITVESAEDSSVNFKFKFGDDTGDLGEDIVRIGESVFVAKDEVVAGDVVVFGGNVIIEGTVAGSVVVLGGEIRARRGAQVRGDVVAIGGSIEEDEEVVIRGEKILIGGVAGAIGDHLNISARLVRAIISAVSIFVGMVLFFITMLFLRARVERVSEHVSGTMLKCFGAGVLTSIAGLFGLMIVMIPLIITIVGIPLAVILAVSCVGVYVIACTTFVYSVGRAFANRAGIEAGVFLRLLLGLVILSIPELIAFALDTVGHGAMSAWIVMKAVSVFVWLFAYIVGLGAIVVSRFGSRPLGTEPPGTRMVGEPAGVPAT